ncbi:hypothetical protein SAMN05216352_12120 [Alteribacillus bidgolensis]|uniref:Uncharacterized protein n=1 Tax=Alteribacillus bidgolensis TaxID=930129 RepID=A0A1G8QPA0_9BACI|nr:hypothetical protein SAMN05216352_12120 [Alteribacillus bidgolensis]
MNFDGKYQNLLIKVERFPRKSQTFDGTPETSYTIDKVQSKTEPEQ